MFAFRIPRQLRAQINCVVYLQTLRLNSRNVPPFYVTLVLNLPALGICDEEFSMLVLT